MRDFILPSVLFALLAVRYLGFQVLTVNKKYQWSCSVLLHASSDTDSIVDEEDMESFERITQNYLTSKFKDCRGDDCRLFCEKEEVASLLRSILPPVSPKELDAEVSSVMSTVSDGLLEVGDFLTAASKNSFWKKAGPLVVKELIFLDCLNSYYFEKRNMLSDDDYNELKEQLTWEGSSAATMSGKEAHFVSAVTANRKGQPIMSDAEYLKLKGELLSEGSWVALRQADPLEKLGIDTFMGYLHRSF